MRKETEWHSEAPAFHWCGEHCLVFPQERRIKKIQEESRTSLFICFLCITALSIIHNYFFPYHLVSSLSDTQLSYKSCGNESCTSPAFTALYQANPQRCLDTPSSLDTALCWLYIYFPQINWVPAVCDLSAGSGEILKWIFYFDCSFWGSGW